PSQPIPAEPLPVHPPRTAELHTLPLQQRALELCAVNDAPDRDLAVAIDDTPPRHVGVVGQGVQRLTDAAGRTRVSEQRGDAAIADNAAPRDAAHHSVDTIGKSRHRGNISAHAVASTVTPSPPRRPPWRLARLPRPA